MKDIKTILQIWFEDCSVIKNDNKLPLWQIKCKQHDSIVTLCSFSTEQEFTQFAGKLAGYHPDETTIENCRYEKIMDAIYNSDYGKATI